MGNNRTGKIGEEYAADFLRNRGYTVLCVNCHSRWGEIDIIARDAKYIVFVEVKARDVSSRMHPLEAVTAAKQKKLVKTALEYLQKHPEYQNLQPRFDVVGLITQEIPALEQPGPDVEIKAVRYIANAFDTVGWEG